MDQGSLGGCGPFFHPGDDILNEIPVKRCYGIDDDIVVFAQRTNNIFVRDGSVHDPIDFGGLEPIVDLGIAKDDGQGPIWVRLFEGQD